MEEGKSEVRILDRGLAFLLGSETGHVNERAGKNRIHSRESLQAIEIPHDVFLKGVGARGNKSKSYALGDAKKLIAY